MGNGVIYGRSAEEWDELAAAGWEFLTDCAARGGLTTYTELNEELADRTGQRKWAFDVPAGRAAVGELLGRLADRSFEECGLMISAVCKFLHENDAGSGFYGKAEDLGLIPKGLSKQAKWEFWAMHVAEVQRWARSTSG